MLNKNKCSDIFFNLERTIAKKNIKSYLRYKYMVNNSVSQFQKLQILITLGCLKGELYLLAI